MLPFKTQELRLVQNGSACLPDGANRGISPLFYTNTTGFQSHSGLILKVLIDTYKALYNLRLKYPKHCLLYHDPVRLWISYGEGLLQSLSITNKVGKHKEKGLALHNSGRDAQRCQPGSTFAAFSNQVKMELCGRAFNLLYPPCLLLSCSLSYFALFLEVLIFVTMIFCFMTEPRVQF